MIRALPISRRTIQLDVSLAIVNIVLLLILFFLATGQLLNPPAEQVDLAETNDLPLEALPTPILIVAEDESWTLDGQPVAPALLEVALSRVQDAETLHILIDRNAPATTLMAVTNHPALTDTQLRLVTLRRPQVAP